MNEDETAAERDRLREANKQLARGVNLAISHFDHPDVSGRARPAERLRTLLANIDETGDIPPLAPITRRPVVPVGLLTTQLLEAARRLLTRTVMLEGDGHTMPGTDSPERIALRTAIDAMDAAIRESDAALEAEEAGAEIEKPTELPPGPAEEIEGIFRAAAQLPDRGTVE